MILVAFALGLLVAGAISGPLIRYWQRRARERALMLWAMEARRLRGMEDDE